AHVGDAGLQQRLGDGEDALAFEDLPRPVAELFDVFGERPLTHAGSSPSGCRLLWHRTRAPRPAGQAARGPGSGAGVSGAGLTRRRWWWGVNPWGSRSNSSCRPASPSSALVSPPTLPP